MTGAAGIGAVAADEPDAQRGAVLSANGRGGGRIGWIDAARGLGIALVVLGHGLGGLIDSPLGGPLGGFRQAFFAIYTFHMPLFFMLSGLLVEPRLARGRAGFLAGLLPTVVWPYFLWSVIQLGVIFAMGSLVNRPAQDWWGTVLALPWHPVSQFWFLQALFGLHVIAAFALPRIGREGLVLAGLAARALAQLVPLDPSLRLILVNLQWYALGVWLGAGGLERLVAARPAWVRAGLLPLVAGGLVLATLRGAADGPGLPLAGASSPQIARLAWQLEAGAAAIAGALAVVGLASVAGAGWLGRGLAGLGRLTMPVYVLHVLFLAGARIGLIRAGVRDPEMLLPAIVAAGLAGPLVAAWALRRAGWSRRLGLA